MLKLYTAENLINVISTATELNMELPRSFVTYLKNNQITLVDMELFC